MTDNFDLLAAVTHCVLKIKHRDNDVSKAYIMYKL